MRRDTHRLLATVAALVTVGAMASAQEKHLMIEGEWGIGLGWGLGVMPDMNQDGIQDLVIGGDTASHIRGGYVAVHSGADGSVLIGPNSAEFNNDLGISAASAGDFDGDGVTDYMAGNLSLPDYGPGEVHVYSGVNGYPIATVQHPEPFDSDQFGFRVYSLGDLDQNGCDDIAVVSYNAWAIPIYGGPDGHLMRRHWVRQRSHVTRLGDVDGDSVPDYAIGDPYYLVNNKQVGLVEVFSGASGDLLYRVRGKRHADYLGVVAPLGDVDGDAVPDWAAGALQGSGCLNSPGFVQYHSGIDGALLRRIDVPSGKSEKFGWTLAGGGDINGDGFWDLLVANKCVENLTSFRVFSGKTGAQLWTLRPDEFPGHNAASHYYRPLAILGDLNQDGFAEFAVGDHFNDLNVQHAGAVHIFRGAPGEAEPVCVATPNSAGDGALLRTRGSISVGDAELVLTVDGAPKGEVGQFVYGPELVDVPYGDGVLCVGGGNLGVVPLSTGVPIDAGGHAELAVAFDQPPIDDGPGAWLPGTTWTVQFLYRDPGGPGGAGINTSDALRITLNP